MRRFRMTIGLVAALAALAVGAAPALAGEFVASKAGKTTGLSESEQHFEFGPFKIKCAKAKANGKVAAGSSSTFAVSISFKKCLAEARLGLGSREIFLGTKFLTPLAIEYHSNGFVETGSEIEEVGGVAVVSGGSAELKVNTAKNEEGVHTECHIRWPEQTIPIKAIKEPEGEFSEATFTNATIPHLMNMNFPTGEQHIIVFENTLKKFKYEYEGEPCEEFGREEGPEAGDGRYTGSFPQVLMGGNLEFR